MPLMMTDLSAYATGVAIEVRNKYFDSNIPLPPIQDLKKTILLTYDRLTVIELGTIYLAVENEYAIREL